MLYNREKKAVKTNKDCLKCEYFDKKEKRCLGFNKKCFEYDAITGSIIDGITKLTIQTKGE